MKMIAKDQWNMGSVMIQWGILNKKWRLIMEEFLSRSRKSAIIRLAEMCNRIWEIIRELWINRCGEEHNNEDSVINIKRNEDSDKKIDEIYNKLPAMRTLPMSDRSFFSKDRKWRKNRN